MNSIHRYYLERAAWKSDILCLRDAEAHHCMRVLRAKQGDKAEIFDGEGAAVVGTITELSKDRVIIRPDSDINVSLKRPRIVLYQAIPKGGNMELIIQKAVELGVASIQPLITENTVVRVEQLKKKQLKWQRIALEACKQCGQNFLPIVREAIEFKAFINEPADAELKVVAALHPASIPMASAIEGSFSSAALLVGPEGDFSDKEYEQAIELGFQPVSLGDIVLRVETATLYCLSVLSYEMGRAGDKV